MKTIRSSNFSQTLTISVLVFAQWLIANAATPTWDWIKTLPGQQSSGVATDGAGIVYWSGVASAGNLGSTPITGISIFLAKLSTVGDVQWTKVDRVAAGSYPSTTVGIDSHSNPILSGWVQSQSVFGTPLNGGGFVIKFDGNGTLKWSRSLGSTRPFNPALAAVGPADAIGVSASFQSTGTLGALAVSSVGDYDVMIGKLDTEGNAQWLKRAGGVNDDIVNAIVSDAFSSFYVGGSYRANASILYHS